jgi:hypothetical protein
MVTDFVGNKQVPKTYLFALIVVVQVPNSRTNVLWLAAKQVREIQKHSDKVDIDVLHGQLVHLSMFWRHRP